MPQLFWLLQVLGDSLSTGWPSILAVLEASATRNEADAGRVVRLGHECLEVVVADFLPLLPRPLLRRALHIEACFVMQVRYAWAPFATQSPDFLLPFVCLTTTATVL